MASYPLPPWLQVRPDDTAQMYAHGLQLGAQISHQRQALQQEAEMEQTRLAVHQQQAEKQFQMETQRLEMARAAQDIQQSLKREALDSAQQRVQLATTVAARRFAASEAYRRRVAGGEDAAKVALEMGPEMGIGAAGMGSLYRQAQPKPTIPPAGVETFGGKQFLGVPHPGGWKNYLALDRSSGSNMGERNLKYRAVSSELAALQKQNEGLLSLPKPPENKDMADRLTAVKKRIGELQQQQKDIAFGAGGTATGNTGAKRWTYDPKSGKLVQAQSPSAQDLTDEPSHDEEDGGY